MNRPYPRRSEQLCAFCLTRKSTRIGEHAIPKWFLDDIHDESPGPYTHEVNGQPLLKNDGKPWSQNYPLVAQLAACEPCNAILAKRFEESSKDCVRALRDSSTEPFTAEDWQKLAQWHIKTTLIYFHPRTQYAHEVREKADYFSRGSTDHALYSWMVTGGAPPPGIHMWIARFSDEGPSRHETDRLPAEQRFAVTSIQVGGEVYESRSFRWSIYGGPWVQVGYYPGWDPVLHPMGDHPGVYRLWPPQHRYVSGSPSALILLDAADAERFLHCTYKGGPSVLLPPGSDIFTNPLDPGICL